jgi:xylulokinase
MPGLWCVDTGMNATGLALRWAAGVLAGGDLAALEQLAAGAPMGSEGVLFLPYLADGERMAPGARAGWSDLSLRHGPAHLARAVYEGVTFGLRAALDSLRAAGLPLSEVCVSGGGARSALWSQLKADMFGLPVAAAQEREAAALGAAMLAGLGTGLYASPEVAVEACVRLDEPLIPRPAAQQVYDAAFARWARAASVGEG